MALIGQPKGNPNVSIQQVPYQRVELTSDRSRELAKLFRDALKVEQDSLNGRPLETYTFADICAVVLAAYESGGKELLKERLKPRAGKQGFDPLWGDKTYEMVTDRGSEGIKCLRCDMVSFHPKDIEHLYCGHCEEFHDG